ncbi:MAG: hypothetical protein ACI8T1_001856, partial [Verrucomicrobiales bacterium]
DHSVSRALSPPHAGALLHVEWSINMIHTFQWIGETGHCRHNQMDADLGRASIHVGGYSREGAKAKR